MDYKPFKDEATWIRFKERFTTIESRTRTYIDKHVIDNLDLDKIQRGWLYKILQDSSTSRQVNRHQTLMTRILARSGKN
jgi:hypothetical protein